MAVNLHPSSMVSGKVLVDSGTTQFRNKANELQIATKLKKKLYMAFFYITFHLVLNVLHDFCHFELY